MSSASCEIYSMVFADVADTGGAYELAEEGRTTEEDSVLEGLTGGRLEDGANLDAD